MFQKYGKSIVAVLAAVLIALQSALTGGVSAAEVLVIITAGVTAFVVWLAPSLPGAAGVKAVAGLALTALNAAGMLLVDGWSTSDTISVVIAVAGALGVLGAPSQSVGDDLVSRTALRAR